MKNRRMRTRMYGGVRGRKTKKVGRNSKIFVFLLLDYWEIKSRYPQIFAKFVKSEINLTLYEKNSFDCYCPCGDSSCFC